jgi:WD40 repeat protein
LKLEAGDGLVHSIVSSAGGDQLFSADAKGAVRVWRRVESKWNLERTFHVGDAPYWVQFSRHGELAAYLKDDSLDVWDVATATKLRSLQTEADWSMRNAALDMSLRRIAAGYVNKRADRVGWALWDLDTGERVHKVDMPSLGNTYLNGLDFTKANDRLVIGFDEALLVYEMANFQRTSFFGFDATKAVACSPTDPYFAAINIRGSITVWNSVNNQQLATLQHAQTGASREDLAFSPDGRYLAASNADSIHIWELTRADEKTVMVGHEGGIPCAAFDPEGRLLATAGKDDQVRFWNPSTGQLVGSVGLGIAAQALAFSADGKLLAVGCMGGTEALHLRLIDVQTRQTLHEESSGFGDVHSLAWVERGDSYLAACGARGVALWKVSRNSPFGKDEKMRLDRNWCLATTLNTQGSILVWTEDDWRLQAWDIERARQKPLHAPPMFSGWHGVTFFPDGESIIFISKSGIAEIWNINEDRRVRSIGERGTFNAPHIALSPDGLWLAALTRPDAISIWHIPTAKHVLSLRPEGGSVWSLAWDHHSERLAVGHSDGRLAVWHLPRIKQKLAASGLEWQTDNAPVAR